MLGSRKLLLLQGLPIGSEQVLALRPQPFRLRVPGTLHRQHSRNLLVVAQRLDQLRALMI